VDAAGFAGVFVFELVDEWFKKNWNILKIDPNRKAWHNQLSSEQYYGIVSADVRTGARPLHTRCRAQPHSQGHGPQPVRPVVVDGRFNDWEAITSPLLADSQYSYFSRVAISSDAGAWVCAGSGRGVGGAASSLADAGACGMTTQSSFPFM
jgi:hypothetical protein